MDYNIILGKSELNKPIDIVDAYEGNLNIFYSSYKDNGVYLCKISNANTTTSPTLDLDNGVRPILKNDGATLSIGELIKDSWVFFMYSDSLSAFLYLGTNSNVNDDTGWLNLKGFDYYAPSIPSNLKPQIRRIGKQLFFRGNVFIPLDSVSSPGTVVPLTSFSDYNSIAGCTPYAGAGGMDITSSGILFFNESNSVLPDEITSNPDVTYNTGWITATRQINIDATYGTALSAMIGVGITTSGQLYISTIHDLEISTTRATGVEGNAPLRFLTSNVNLGDYLPNYKVSNLQSFATTGPNVKFEASTTFAELSNHLQYPFTCDASNENNLGGFFFKLDTLKAYID